MNPYDETSKALPVGEGWEGPKCPVHYVQKFNKAVPENAMYIVFGWLFWLLFFHKKSDITLLQQRCFN